MISSALGTAILGFEVTSIGKHGFWNYEDGAEYFVSFADYPVFRKATVESILNVTRSGPGQYHWPDLDADIEKESLVSPEVFLKMYREVDRPGG